MKTTDEQKKALRNAKRIGCPCIRDKKNPYKYLCLGHFPGYQRAEIGGDEIAEASYLSGESGAQIGGNT